MTTLVRADVTDLRFPTSKSADGSDAMNSDPDYSAAYVRLVTDDDTVYGCGFTFTIGRGNDVCCAAISALAQLIIGESVDDLCNDLGGVHRRLRGDSQLRWLGPDKGVVNLALGAVMNALWDMASRRVGKPLWQFVADMTPEQLVDAADLSHLGNALTRDEALAIVERGQVGKDERLADLQATGYPCYTTSAGWLGYSDEKLRRLCQEAVDEGYQHIKLKVGADRVRDRERLTIAREVLGPDRKLMIDANQVWEVPEAIERVNELADFDLWWIEEPTHPDDVLGHAEIRRAVAPVRVATGEHGMNRVLFKQLLQAEAIDFLQLDTCRLAGICEILAVQMLAAKYGIPVCPHAGGVGLCELVNHVVMIDHLVIATSKDDRVAEYVDHLHEHFVDPCIVRNAAYTLPTAPGYSAEIKAETFAEFSYPDGSYWQANP
ncbi:enolase C-terminal domain-like protein [Aestuariimicrobium ganziense]|uniref:enolase C-terminal domain-like protein n=1 Tax=Aestuariimicrobium ganziense TaxID=2773677 RepID=UPI001942AD22|nr:enolase C-terminal domain-like protein [Aestuariimicrobium ganziense]